MKLLLPRSNLGIDSILGRITIAGAHECFTLERRTEIADHPGIAPGVFPIKIGASAHFKGKDVIHVLNVPNRSEIEIHIANFASELLGCIAVGQSIGPRQLVAGSMQDFLEFSKDAFNDLIARVAAAEKTGEENTLQIW